MKKLSEAGREICSFYAALNRLTPGLNWKLTPKMHLLCHLVEIIAPRWGNPRYYWCYADADLVGHMVEVAKACHPSTLHHVALFKFCWQLAYQ